MRAALVVWEPLSASAHVGLGLLLGIRFMAPSPSHRLQLSNVQRSHFQFYLWLYLLLCLCEVFLFMFLCFPGNFTEILLLSFTHSSPLPLHDSIRPCSAAAACGRILWALLGLNHVLGLAVIIPPSVFRMWLNLIFESEIGARDYV